MRDQPWYRLTRHFFDALFDFGFLSDAGVRSFTRLLLGIAAMFLSFGLLLVRVYMYRYGSLMARDTPEPYRLAVLADSALLFAIPMWVVAFVTVLVGHALFPDETDFRVLMALPVTRRLVFGTKLLAVLLFAGLFVVPVHAALMPVFGLMSLGRWAEHPFIVQFIAFESVNLLASAWAVLAVAALQGLVVMYAPRGRVFAISAALRSVLLCGLVLSLPFVGRLPGQGTALSRGSFALYFAPPAWFVGVERWLLGDARAPLLSLAMIALAAVVVAGGMATWTYAVLYRRFDRVMQGPVEGASGRRIWRRRARQRLRRPVFTAIRAFAAITLRRSVFHQGIFVVLSAVGGGLVINSLLGAGIVEWLRGEAAGSRLTGSLMWGPFALIYVASLAVRVALAVPIEVRANWVFRMSEQDAARADQLSAAAHVLGWLGVVLPAALLLPLQWALMGPRALGVFLAALAAGWLFGEILMRDWARIPFTCTYLPGKEFLPQLILKFLASFVVFTTLGTALSVVNLVGRPITIIANAVVLGIAFLLRWRRRHMWKDVTLAFDDDLPTEANPLRLH